MMDDDDDDVDTVDDDDDDDEEEEEDEEKNEQKDDDDNDHSDTMMITIAMAMTMMMLLAVAGFRWWVLPLLQESTSVLGGYGGGNLAPTIHPQGRRVASKDSDRLPSKDGRVRVGPRRLC